MASFHVSYFSFFLFITLISAAISATDIPSLPVEWQAQSCMLDLNNQVLGGVKEACHSSPHSPISRKRCCPVLEAWLMAARANVALRAPRPEAPGMPLLPDDSMVCVANMKAALESHGFFLTPPNATCDVVYCFCGIRLSQSTMAKCPTTLLQTKSIAPIPTPSNYSTKALVSNCTHHSHKGCTHCLSTLEKIATNMSTNLSKEEKMGCELMGLMGLLVTNKTLYIPTVSAVLRALLYSGNNARTSTPKCSPDWENMPLALDSSQVEHSKAQAPTSSANVLGFSRRLCLCSLVLVMLVLGAILVEQL